MNDAQMQAAAEIIMPEALKLMAQKSGLSVDDVRSAILSGVPAAVEQFNQLIKIGYETTVRTMYGAL